MILSIIAPCMNEETVLEEFYLRIVSVVNELQIKDYEMILVDDGSRDETWKMIRLLSSKNQRVKGIRLSRNFGHQAALTAGLESAKGEMVFIIDSDLQDPPELLGPMIRKLNEGFDVVYGQRNMRLGETKFKLLTANFFYRLLSKIAEVEIPKDTGDFRLINKKVLESYKRFTESQRFTRGLISWLGFNQTALLYDRKPRFSGHTKYSFNKMINFSIDAITGFSLKPLRLIILMGIITSAIFSGAFLYSVYGWLYAKTIPWWASLIMVLCMLGCAQLICLGIVGEYVGRIFTESKKRPLYIVSENSDDFSNIDEFDLLKKKLSSGYSEHTSMQ